MDSKLPSDLNRLIVSQGYVVTRQQWIRAGLPQDTIRSRVRRGQFQRLYPGVYRTVGGDVPWKAQLWAAQLYAGQGARLSHKTAAEILGLTDRRSPVIEVTIPAPRRVATQPGLKIYRTRLEYQGWLALPSFPPHTFHADTVLDLIAATDNLDDAVAWVSKGIAGRKVSGTQLQMAARSRRRFRWGGELETIVGSVLGGSHFPLEFRYDRDVERAHGLPATVKQGKFQKSDGSWGYRDRRYDEYGLIVELDGKKFHDDEQLDRDRVRDNEAVATTGATLRYGWSDVTRTPCDTAAQVYRALRKRGYEGTLKPCSAACRALSAAA